MQARLNEIKDREDFRPVAPVVSKRRRHAGSKAPAALRSCCSCTMSARKEGRDPRRLPCRRHRPHPDGQPRAAPRCLRPAQGLRAPDRRARPDQYLVQHAGKPDRVLAPGCARMFLYVPAGCPRDRPFLLAKPGVIAMSIAVSVVIPTFQRNRSVEAVPGCPVAQTFDPCRLRDHRGGRRVRGRHAEPWSRNSRRAEAAAVRYLANEGKHGPAAARNRGGERRRRAHCLYG